MLRSVSWIQQIPAYKNLLFESQAEVGSCFKGTKTNFKVQRILLEGCLMWALSESENDVEPYYLVESGEENQTLTITNRERESNFKAKWDQNELNNSNQKSTLLPLQ